MLIIYTRLFGLPMSRRLVPALFVILLVLSQADAITSWELLREQLLAWSAFKLSLVFSILMAGWAFAAGHALRPCWQQPPTRLLKRQPVSLVRWSFYLLPSMLIAIVPVAVLWWLLPQHLPTPLHYLTAMLVAWPMVVGASFSGLRALMVSTGLCLAVSLGLLLYLGTGFGALLPIAAVCLIPVSLRPLWWQVYSKRPGMRSRLSQSHLVMAMAIRDCSYLMTQKKRVLAGHLVFALFLVLMLLAMRINGQMSAEIMYLAACIKTGVFSIAIYDMLEKIRLGMGHELFRIRWPVSVSHRLYSFYVIGGSAMLLMVLLCVIAGSSMDWLLPLYLLFAVTSLLMLTAVFCLRLRWQHREHGAAVWALVLLVYCITLAAHPIVFALVSLLLGVVSIQLAIQGLKTYAIAQEFG